MKRAMPLCIRQGHYDSYLAEHIWRKNNDGSDLFVTFLHDVAHIYAPQNHD